MSKDLLLEIGTEEIPAAFLPKALSELKSLGEELLERERLPFQSIHAYATPRRMILHVNELPDRQRDLSRTVAGPPRAVSFDPDGNPTKAAVGFAKSQGVDLEELSVRETPKGEYLCVVKKERGSSTRSVLERILPGIITSLRFPKTMRWGSGTLRFVRPIHWILALYDEEIIPFEMDGIKSGNLSRGHRFMSPGSFTVHGFKSYRASARERFIMFDPEERKKEIVRQIEKIEGEVGGRVIRDPDLLEEVSYLVEYPTVLCGGFDPRFLSLPRQVLITSMREHQRYFSMEDERGELIPYFVTVSNTRPKDTRKIISGNERVLRARLTDADYFFQVDRKRSLESYVEDLKGVTFQEKLGTLFEKAERVVCLARWLAENVEGVDRDMVSRAALLCKADLTTEMVGEFPSLQGEMGKVYARLSGESEGVARCIEEHYRPRFAGDGIPESLEGAVVGLADRIDTIVGCFGVGLVPSGSEDPYALRRQTMAVLTILLQKDLPVSLKEIITRATGLLTENLSLNFEETPKAVLEFFRGRLSGMLIAEGHRYDTVEAVLEAGFDSLPDTRARVRALSVFRKTPLFEPFTVVCKRAMNILQGGRKEGEIDQALFQEEAEGKLYAALLQMEKTLPELIQNGKYEEGLVSIASLREPIDSFFDHVMVMDKEEGIRENRLTLLTRVASLIAPVADFSKIVVD